MAEHETTEQVLSAVTHREAAHDAGKSAEWESEQKDLDNCCDVRGGQDRCGDCPKDRGLTRIAPTKVFPEPRQDSAVFGAPRPAPSDYTPTTRGVRQGYASGRHRRGEMLPVAAKKAFDRWLAAHDAQKRAEWEAEQAPEKDERLVRFMAMATPLGYQSALTVVQEMTKLLAAEDIARSLAEQGETEWEYGWVGVDEAGDEWVAEMEFGSRAEAESFEKGRGWIRRQGGSLHRRRKPGDWLPVTNTESESEFAPGECDGSSTCSAPIHIHGCYTPHRSDQCDSPDEYGHIDSESEGKA